MTKNFFEVKNVDFSVSGKTKVKDVSFSIKNEGDVICLLGPSGIGKTTILRTIAGLEKIEKGSIELNNKILSSKTINVEPENRNISLAFQDNSLFPHYTVEKNILLGAERNKEKKDKKIGLKEIVDLLDIFHILNKYPHQISAGEAQRASLARSLITQPDLLLLDEPLSNVDQSFKEEIQVRLKKILNKLKITTIIVTHDSYEAFYLGSKCGIIINQELKQFDDPYKVYHFPNSIEVVNNFTVKFSELSFLTKFFATWPNPKQKRQKCQRLKPLQTRLQTSPELDCPSPWQSQRRTQRPSASYPQHRDSKRRYARQSTRRLPQKSVAPRSKSRSGSTVPSVLPRRHFGCRRLWQPDLDVKPVESLTGQQHEQQNALKDTCHNLWHAKRNLRRVAAKFCQRDNKASANHSQWVETRQKGHNDRGKTIAERDVRLQLANVC